MEGIVVCSGSDLSSGYGFRRYVYLHAGLERVSVCACIDTDNKYAYGTDRYQLVNGTACVRLEPDDGDERVGIHSSINLVYLLPEILYCRYVFRRRKGLMGADNIIIRKEDIYYVNEHERITCCS